MPSIDDIVKVTITKESFAVSRAGFGVPLLVYAQVVTANRFTLFSNTADMITAGFVSTDPAFLGAQAAFSQTPRLSQIAIGREDVGDTDVADTMTQIEAENEDGWYSFAYGSTRAEADILLLAPFAESRDRMFFAQSSDAAVLANTVGNVAEDLANGGFSRTALFFHAIDTEFADAATLARMLVADMDAINGAITLTNKRIATLTPNVVTLTERTNIFTNSANLIENRLGETIVREGTMATGEFPDVIMTIDWLTFRLTEDLFALLVGTSTKIPFTQSGIDSIEAVVRARLRIAIDNGHLDDFNVDLPLIGEVSSGDKNVRTLNNVTFTGTLQGAIHTINVVGKVSA